MNTARGAFRCIYINPWISVHFDLLFNNHQQFWSTEALLFKNLRYFMLGSRLGEMGLVDLGQTYALPSRLVESSWRPVASHAKFLSAAPVSHASHNKATIFSYPIIMRLVGRDVQQNVTSCLGNPQRPKDNLGMDNDLHAQTHKYIYVFVVVFSRIEQIIVRSAPLNTSKPSSQIQKN